MDTAVYEIQSYLRNVSRIDRDIPSLIPDGIFGPETAESILAFQRKHLMPQTGKVDFDTWNRILDESDKAVFIFSEPIQTAPVRNGDFPLKKGKQSHLNSNINIMLSRLSDFYGNFGGAVPSQDYTDETERLIGVFQELTEIPITGEVDKTTWNLLSSLYLLLTEDKSA